MTLDQKSNSIALQMLKINAVSKKYGWYNDNIHLLKTLNKIIFTVSDSFNWEYLFT